MADHENETSSARPIRWLPLGHMAAVKPEAFCVDRGGNLWIDLTAETFSEGTPEYNSKENVDVRRDPEGFTVRFYRELPRAEPDAPDGYPEPMTRVSPENVIRVGRPHDK